MHFYSPKRPDRLSHGKVTWASDTPLRLQWRLTNMQYPAYFPCVSLTFKPVHDLSCDCVQMARKAGALVCSHLTANPELRYSISLPRRGVRAFILRTELP